jgi:hypothetical protein
MHVEQVNSICAHAVKKYPDKMWMFDIQRVYWEGLRDAHKKWEESCIFVVNQH